MLIEVQHTLIGVGQDPTAGVLVDELIVDGLFHLWTIEPVNQARNQGNGTKLFVGHSATHQIVQSLQLRYVGTHLLSELNLTQTQSIDRGDRFFDRCQLAIVPNIDDFALIGSLQDVATEGSVDHRSFIYEDDGVLMDSPASGLLDLGLTSGVVILKTQVHEGVDGATLAIGGLTQLFCCLVRGSSHVDLDVLGINPHDVADLVIFGHDLIDHVTHEMGLTTATRARDDHLFLIGQQEFEEVIRSGLLALVQVVVLRHSSILCLL